MPQCCVMSERIFIMEIVTSLTTRKISELKPHMINEKIYGENEDIKSLVDSIRKSGIVETLTIDENNIIISGHRRWRACQQLVSEGLTQFETVNCMVCRYENEPEKIQALLVANDTRIKSQWQIATEARIRLKVEQDLADMRRRSTQNNNSAKKAEVVNLPPQGKARDIVAKEMGYSGKTIDKMVAIVNKTEELEKQGRIDEANLIKDALENQSVEAASKLAKNINNISDKAKTDLREGKTTANKAITASKTAQTEVSVTPTSIEKEITPSVKSTVYKDNTHKEVSDFESLLGGVRMTEDEVQEKSELMRQYVYSWNETALDLIYDLIDEAEKKYDKLYELDEANSESEEQDKGYKEALQDWLDEQMDIQQARSCSH